MPSQRETREMKRALKDWMKKRPPANFKEGEVIIPIQQTSGCFGYLRKGLVKATARIMPVKHPKVRTVDIFGPGHWLGVEAFGAAANLFKYDAIEESAVVLADINDFNLLPQSLLLEIGRQMANRQVANLGATQLTKENLKTRVIYRLFNLRKQLGKSHLHITQEDLADLVGSTQASISLILKALIAKGIVQRGYGSYKITQSQALFKEALREAGMEG